MTGVTWLRAICGVLVAWVVMWGALALGGWLVVVVAIVGAVAGGVAGRSWWSVVLVPTALACAFWVYRNTDCPDCGGGGEEATVAWAKWIAYFVWFGMLAGAAAAGAGLDRVVGMLRGGEGGERRTAASVGLWAAGGSVLAILAVGLPVGRYVSDRDANGDVVVDAGRVRYREGKPWDPGEERSLSRGEMEAFTGFPVYWFGMTVEGFNLSHVYHQPGRLDVVNAPGAEALNLIYGECGPAPCNPAIQINIQPACSVTPSFALGATEPVTLPGGAMLRRAGPGHVLIWSGGSFVTVYSTARPELIDSLLARLRTARAPGSGLVAPDFFRCPDAVGVG